jgi:drug/metabolite transporter (DMT)-like permease
MVDLLSVILVLISAALGAVGTLLMKKETDRMRLIVLWRSSIVWGGLFLYALSVLLYVFALRREELSILYPLVSTTYIWTMFLSVKYLGERMNRYKWISLLGIIVGVMLIGLGS